MTSSQAVAEKTHHYRFYGIHQIIRVDDDLVEAFRNLDCPVSIEDVYEVNISYKNFYSVLKSVDAHNAPILMDHGYTDSESVVGFLLRHNLSHLIRKNARLVAHAKKLRILPGSFVDIYMDSYRARSTNDEIMRALEIYAEVRKMPYVRETIVPMIINKKVSYDDAKTIGFGTIEHSPNKKQIVDALDATRRDPNVTLNHIKSVLAARYNPELDHREGNDGTSLTALLDTTEKDMFSLMKLLGGDIVVGFKNPVYLSRSIHRFRYENYSREELIRLYQYADEIRTLTDRMSDPSPQTLDRMMAAGVRASLVAEGFTKCWSNDRIIALHEGVAAPLTDGWV